jgi:cytochrome c oxidase cbb3-type subunit 2
MNSSVRAFAVAVSALSALGFGIFQSAGASLKAEAVDPVVLGRQVYVSEGCIHCHSQYVRPVGPDQELWGFATSVEEALGQSPVLIGNRRQGPDLANVGLRRDATWNRVHLIDPPSVSPGSRMPSYRHLFTGDTVRGEALLSYLSQLKGSSGD